VACGCCAPSGYAEFFSEKQARRDARRYRRKGLDKAARWIVDTVRSRGVEGATVLEPGGGVGAIEIELLKAGAARSIVVELSPGYEQAAAELARVLKRGAARATNLELSAAYDEEARALLAEAGLLERVERRVHDIAVDPESVEPADVLVLHRVVCCYPDYERLLGAAADRARRVLVFTYPPRNAASRALFALANAWMRLRGREFRAFAHPPRAMLEVVRARGFQPYAYRRARIWQGAAFIRG